jgi:hypothetical protein
MSMLFIRPAGPSITSIEDFLRVSMSHDLPDQEFVVDETGIDE